VNRKIFQFHPQAKAIKEVLRKNGINALYHFTDIRNLSLIARCGGLWSKEKLEQEGLLSQVITGGDELSLNLDRGLGNWDKVHLYFCPHTPMAYIKQQEKHLCYLIIDPEVALRSGVIFTDTNATRTTGGGHQREEGIKGLHHVDFEVIKETLTQGPKPQDPRWHRNVQAEVLVPDEIPLRYIKEIAFISEASLKEGKRLWGDIRYPSFRVIKELFTPGIPYLKSAILTDEEVNRNTLGQSFLDKRVFKIRQDLRIFLLLQLYATANLKAKVVWKSVSEGNILEKEAEFDKQSMWWHWSALQAGNLKPGRYSVEYYLGDIHWITIPFILEV